MCGIAWSFDNNAVRAALVEVEAVDVGGRGDDEHVDRLICVVEVASNVGPLLLIVVSPILQGVSGCGKEARINPSFKLLFTAPALGRRLLLDVAMCVAIGLSRAGKDD